MRTKIFYGILMAFGIVITSCSDDKGSGSSDGMGTLSVRMTDKPYPYDLMAEANVTVFKIEARQVQDDNADDSSSPYITLMEEEIEMNLLELTNGVTEQLANIEVPAGTYDLIRVYVTGVNVVLTDETVFDLKVPSGSSSGIKVFVEPGITVTSGLSTDLLLDFDVSSSFVAKGSFDTPAGINGFNFKPVIKATNASTAGTLAGNVSTLVEEVSTPLEGTLISVFAADTLNTTSFTDVDGNYAIMGLEAGMYEVLAEIDGYISSDTLDVQIDVANITTQDFVLEAEPEEETTTETGN
ncbi:DUF4382 domain-containing protein [Flagellimonas zhangzhouensis]|uniref:Carboxypeptidase regulatory-like domain-containing protein n=1 Tax=Flagellimonas zhangzhouensis TaxID=1073328 RepID=A0A1H2S6X2_9FLAO|nr:DUF4382 domain-containing protein [Allomuricauda zhangzhouensis]SDQ70763.1 Carboxypeptidase regulatory-like domain-containing protein [Allomuricauda zhangzhouensis]SDW26709.1 Carboxypeptidase regulatory-like domain-containing protein [Allomuricauda zhangzhouensis]